MSMKLINIRMDEELKKEMEIVCNDLGMNITTAFTIFAKKLTREKRIPFNVSIDPFYSNKNIKAIEKSINEVKEGKVVIKSIEDLEAME
ncbi:type II toxin-antitoxin system antitoxin, RelB/DinJ family [Fusobacterium polymorphum]|uniref:Type II toxin-antitoxin system antitoxin, RelB/DinJ family n=1 Tax=Fusobacterium nucleatum subsp. polymorphum TaxID=76857 RepID=A0A2B7YIH0_FUSNP|nr:type II toxin-antitoxin system RelB/DinJ family antitoxin [Fusobacterium polymorphum]PGH21085.1 type II toxin-antitoxin system antitoxin, RelB/DinJ family [Fusobacterium polymorphum]